jgi:hypothetical protein
MLQDSVVAIVPEELLGEILPVIHGSGYGHLARVIRNGKRPLAGQLQRAGVPISLAPDAVIESPAVLLVSAAARSQMAAAMLMRHGASRVWTVSAGGAWNELEDTVFSQPNVHVLPPHPARTAAATPVVPASSDDRDQHPN